jgi:threonine synthase
MVLAVAKAIEAGSSTIVCASTGNTSASAAAYGAHCGLRTAVVIPDGRIAAGKLVQAQVFGALVIAIRGNFDDALRVVRELADTHPVTVVNSINPHRIEGQKTAAFEIVDDLGFAPDVLAIPVGNAGNITAYWKGFREYSSAGRCSLPRMIGGQAAGAAPLVQGAPVPDPETVATAIRIGNPASWESAIAARDESGGLIAAVTDAEILAAQRDLATCEGIFCEPASAASFAVLRQCRSDDRIKAGVRAVCVLTGNGLKDLAAVEGALRPVLSVSSDAASIAQALGS